jgi:hypothetical protein
VQTTAGVRLQRQRLLLLVMVMLRRKERTAAAAAAARRRKSQTRASLLTDTEQVVQLIKGIEYCQNTAVLQRFAGERLREAEEKLKVQTRVVEALRKQLKEETDTLLRAKAFSLTLAGRSLVNAWCAMKEKEVARCKEFF